MMNRSFLFKNTFRGTHYQNVRWNKPRKPFWLGVAKSKKFVVREEKVLPNPDRNELHRLKRIYNTDMKSLMQFIKYENPLFRSGCVNNSEGSSEMEDSVSEEMEDSVSEEMADTIERNNIWNAESAERRNKRLEITDQSNFDEAVAKISNLTELKKKLHSQIEDIVRKEIELSKSYITLENLDEAVEKCLNEEVNHDYALDINGNKFWGQKVFQNPDKTFDTKIAAEE